MAKIVVDFDNLESILVSTVIGRTAEGDLVGAWMENPNEIPLERAQIAQALRSLADGFDEQSVSLAEMEQAHNKS